VAATPLLAVVGLGNPGPEHLATRHNAGFWFVDRLAHRYGGAFRNQSRYHGDVARIRIGAEDVLLLKPMTYMNRSGIAVRALVDYLKVPTEALLVVHDELDLPIGTARFKRGGGAGGHNGIRDTIRHIGPEFWRLRLGIGHPGDKSVVIDHVLERATREEETAIRAAIETASDALEVFVTDGAEKAMNRLHAKQEEAGERSAADSKKTPT
jgi:PTH1 family peptidyl-tRNA hydrolase